MVETVNVNLQIFLIYSVLTSSLKAHYKKDQNIIYILLWTPYDSEPFMFWKLKQVHFVAMNCEFQNCYLTDQKSFFEDMTDFGAILFNAVDLAGDMEFPLIRSDNQIYVFVSTDSATNYPIRSEDFNYYFNYSWTYKLNSDIPFPYIIIRDKQGNVLGPKTNMRWMDENDMDDINETDKNRFLSKSIAAAWFVTNCGANNNRLKYANDLKIALCKYNLSLHIYGHCGDRQCPRDYLDECFQRIESDYYFYLSFENSFSEDYVTEKVLTALEHSAVPIVYGGADYSRFLPPGTYLNAMKFKEEELAKKMNEIITKQWMYYNFFKWRRYYTYHASDDSGDTHPLCIFCAFLNDELVKTRRRVYPHFTQWWNEFEYTVDSPVLDYGFGAPNNKAYYIFKFPNNQIYNISR